MNLHPVHITQPGFLVALRPKPKSCEIFGPMDTRMQEQVNLSSAGNTEDELTAVQKELKAPPNELKAVQNELKALQNELAKW